MARCDQQDAGRRCASPKTSTRSTHSRRTVPIRRSTYGFCHGDRGEIGRSRFVTGGAAIPAAMQATSTIPIVFALAVDAIREGIITNLARPGGNVTGLSALSSETASKRLQILSEVI